MRFAIAVCLLVACGLVVAVHHDELGNPAQFDHMNTKAKRSVMNGLPYAYGYNHVPIEPFMTFDYRQPFGELRPEVNPDVSPPSFWSSTRTFPKLVAAVNPDDDGAVNPDDDRAVNPDVVYRVLKQRAAADRTSAEAAQNRGVAIQVTANLVYDYEGPTAVMVDGHRPSDVAETLTFRRYGEYGETAGQQQVIFDENAMGGARPIVVITLASSAAGGEKNAAPPTAAAADNVDATPENPFAKSPTDILAALYGLEEAVSARQIIATTPPAADNGGESSAESASDDDGQPQTATAAPIDCDDVMIVMSADDDDDGTTADTGRPDDPETNEIAAAAAGGHSSSRAESGSAEQIAIHSPATDAEEQNGNDDDETILVRSRKSITRRSHSGDTVRTHGGPD